MRRKSFVQNTLIVILSVAIIIMSVGYAVYSTPLNITGTTKLESALFDVKFSNIKQLSTTTVENSAISLPSISDSTNLTFGVNLSVNSVYEFTVDVINNGTIPAKLSTYTMTGTKGNETVTNSSELNYNNSYLNYTITYLDGTSLNTDDELGVGESRTLKISVSYTIPTDGTELPTTSESYVFVVDLNYIQA